MSVPSIGFLATYMSVYEESGKIDDGKLNPTSLLPFM
jgi:hypothetical protein